jgi:hypothetical protein
LYHLAQIGDLPFGAVGQRVSSLESNRCAPAPACTAKVAHPLAGFCAL